VDATSGLTDIGARWYDSSTGTFASLDPLLETSSPMQLNGYTYAGANPVDGSDPTGELLFGGFGACQTGGCDLKGNKSGATIGMSEGAPSLTPAADYPEPDIGSMCSLCSEAQGYGNRIANMITDPGRIIASSMINMGPTGVTSNGIQFGDTTPDQMGGTNPFGTNDSGSSAYKAGYDIAPWLLPPFGGESLGEELGDIAAGEASGGSGLSRLIMPKIVAHAMTEPAEAGSTWADADELDREFAVSGKSLGVLANITRSGSTVTLSDIIMYGSEGELVNQVDPTAFLSFGRQMLKEALPSGVERITFTGIRVANSSGLTGHEPLMSVYVADNGGMKWTRG
jgi:RHS repeat-associated protein